MLVHVFLERYAPGSDLHVTNAAMKALMQYEWPGNVRELENCVERAVALGNGQLIDLGDLPAAIAAATSIPIPVRDPAKALRWATNSVAKPLLGPPQAPLSTTDLEDIERATIQRVLSR